MKIAEAACVILSNDVGICNEDVESRTINEKNKDRILKNIW